MGRRALGVIAALSVVIALVVSACIGPTAPESLVGASAPSCAPVGDAPVPTTPSYSIVGLPWRIVDGAARIPPIPGPDTLTGVEVHLFTTANACGGAWGEQPNSGELSIYGYWAGGAAPSPCAITLQCDKNEQRSPSAFVAVHFWDDACKDSLDALNFGGQCGTVTFTSFDPLVAGSFDVTLSNEHITGTFAAPLCLPGDAGACVPR
jgi:hypothetical protein